MSKDKVYGSLLLIISILVILYYTYWAVLLNINPNLQKQYPFNLIPVLDPIWAIILPMWLAIVIVFLILAWIGWTMLTTPPPDPLEELEETEEEVIEEATEEKKEETSESEAKKL